MATCDSEFTSQKDKKEKKNPTKRNKESNEVSVIDHDATEGAALPEGKSVTSLTEEKGACLKTSTSSTSGLDLTEDQCKTTLTKKKQKNRKWEGIENIQKDLDGDASLRKTESNDGNLSTDYKGIVEENIFTEKTSSSSANCDSACNDNNKKIELIEGECNASVTKKKKKKRKKKGTQSAQKDLDGNTSLKMESIEGNLIPEPEGIKQEHVFTEKTTSSCTNVDSAYDDVEKMTELIEGQCNAAVTEKKKKKRKKKETQSAQKDLDGKTSLRKTQSNEGNLSPESEEKDCDFAEKTSFSCTNGNSVCDADKKVTEHTEGQCTATVTKKKKKKRKLKGTQSAQKDLDGDTSLRKTESSEGDVRPEPKGIEEENIFTQNTSSCCTNGDSINDENKKKIEHIDGTSLTKEQIMGLSPPTNGFSELDLTESQCDMKLSKKKKKKRKRKETHAQKDLDGDTSSRKTKSNEGDANPESKDIEEESTFREKTSSSCANGVSACDDNKKMIELTEGTSLTEEKSMCLKPSTICGSELDVTEGQCIVTVTRKKKRKRRQEGAQNSQNDIDGNTLTKTKSGEGHAIPDSNGLEEEKVLTEKTSSGYANVGDSAEADVKKMIELTKDNCNAELTNAKVKKRKRKRTLIAEEDLNRDTFLRKIKSNEGDLSTKFEGTNANSACDDDNKMTECTQDQHNVTLTKGKVKKKRRKGMQNAEKDLNGDTSLRKYRSSEGDLSSKSECIGQNHVLIDLNKKPKCDIDLNSTDSSCDDDKKMTELTEDQCNVTVNEVEVKTKRQEGMKNMQKDLNGDTSLRKTRYDEGDLSPNSSGMEQDYVLTEKTASSHANGDSACVEKKQTVDLNKVYSACDDTKKMTQLTEDQCNLTLTKVEVKKKRQKGMQDAEKDLNEDTCLRKSRSSEEELSPKSKDIQEDHALIEKTSCSCINGDSACDDNKKMIDLNNDVVDEPVRNDVVPQDPPLSVEGTGTQRANKKLLILDVNGLLADLVPYVPFGVRPDARISTKSVFKRPYCDDFLQFCFEKYNVGIWSSRTKRNVDMVVDFLMRDSRHKLLFCWDQSHCTDTGHTTIENRDKPLVLKELKKLWENLEEGLPWKKGEYDESNTLLLDDSPYKALRNPAHTAIFPRSYRYKDREDFSLGPGGDLRGYLERLADAQNVQEFVAQNPFGQRAITESNASWGFYRRILGV